MIAVSGWLISCASVEAISPSAVKRDMWTHLRLQLLQPGLGQLPLGQVADEAGEVALPRRAHLADRELHGKGRAVLALAHDDAPDADDPPLAGRR